MNRGPLPIPVTILAGFLGAGKTTLLNYMLQSLPGRRIAIVQNDFGSVDAIAIDPHGAPRTIEVLADGCACCSMRTRLYATLTWLVHSRQPPQHIIIEASALADPAAIAQLFLDPELRRTAALDAIFVILDTRQGRRMTGELAQLTGCQVRAADIILLNKVDLVDVEGLRATRAWLASLGAKAPVIECTYGRIPADLFCTDHFADGNTTNSVPEDPIDPPLGGRHNSLWAAAAAPAVARWAYTNDLPLSQVKLQTLLAGLLPASLYRASGVLYVAEQMRTRLALHIVGRRVNISDCGNWEDKARTQLSIVGAAGVLPVAELRRLLDNCSA